MGEPDILDNKTRGTLHYMAPEVLQGHLLTCKADVWSLGCLIFELCSQKFYSVDRIISVALSNISSSYSDNLRTLLLITLVMDVG